MHMLENLRTRYGKLLSVIIAVFAVGLLLTFSDSLNGNDASDASTRITGRSARTAGGTAASYKNKSSRKSGAKDAKADGVATPNYSTSNTLHGVTMDEKGKALSGVKITVRRSGHVETIKTQDSDSKGIYALDSLSADTYDILATHDKYVSLIRPSFTIKPADTSVKMDFHLPLGATINGAVVDEEGQPLDNVRVAARKKQAEESKQNGQVLLDDTTYHTQITDKPGTFTLTGISLGINVFEFFVPGYAMERLELDMTPEKAAEQMKVTLKRTGIIAGKVLDENNNPVSTATVSLTRYKPLRSKAETIDKGKLTAVTNAQGEFKFEKLYTEGYYDLIVEEPQFAPGIYPLVPVNSDRVVCQVGVGGEISGMSQLIDRPTTAVSVLVKATALIKGTTFTQETTSDGAGRFKFKKLPYGAYSLNVDDGKFLSEPKDGVACAREVPARDVVVELFETAKVKGRVSDGASDASVPGAQVILKATYGFDKARQKTFTIKTDAHGTFDFPKLPSGVHIAQAEARGFLKGQTVKSQQNFVLVPGERKSDLNLYLDHGGSVEGFVLDPAGRSVADVDIQLFAATQFDGPVDPAKLKGRTDGTGYFKVWGIEVGERVQLYASASKSGYTKTRSGLVELSPKAMDVAVQISISKGGEITGIVTDKNKMPVPGAEVRMDSQAFPGDPSPSHIVVHTEPNGTYRVDSVPPGGATLTVSRAGFVKQGRGVTVRDEQHSDNINFELESGTTIAGLVEDLEGNPIAGAKVKATGIKGAAGSEEDTTDKSGNFELNNLGKGDFRLDATFSITTPEGAQAYHFTNASVRSGTAQAAIECDLANTTSGKVKGEKGKGVDTFTVTLNSKNDTKPSQDFVFNLARGLKDSAGFFRLSKVPRGVYKLTVTADGFEPYTEEEVAIGPHRRTVLSEIRLKPAGGVVGRVFSTTSDRPVNKATVKLESVDDLAGEGKRTVSGSTNMRGDFRVATVPEGMYRVSIDHPSYIGTKLELIHVTEKKERDLGKLFLEPGGAVRGIVENHMGDPVPNMKVTVKGVTPLKQTTTDAAGNYMIQGVQFGRWPVVVEGSMSGKPMYSFQTSDIERDESERLDFMLETTADLSGRLMASGESSLRSASVAIHPFDENNVVLENVHYDSRAQSNNFDISEVPPGQYFLWVAGQGAVSSLSAWKDIFLERGRNHTDVEIASSKVQGKIMTEAGDPVSNVAVQMLPIFNMPRLSQNLYNKLIRPAISSVDGLFTFDNLQAGSYQMITQTAAGGAGGWYAQPIFHLDGGQQIQGLNVLLND